MALRVQFYLLTLMFPHLFYTDLCMTSLLRAIKNLSLKTKQSQYDHRI